MRHHHHHHLFVHAYHIHRIHINIEDSTSSSISYRRETALQGGFKLWPKVGRLELRDNIYGHYRSIFKHCDVIGQQSNRIR